MKMHCVSNKKLNFEVTIKRFFFFLKKHICLIERYIKIFVFRGSGSTGKHNTAIQHYHVIKMPSKFRDR